MTTNLVQLSSDNFSCHICDSNTSRKSQYMRHISTCKHLNTTNTTNNTTDITNNKKVKKYSNSFICECGKEYKHHSSLWNHKKKCNFTPTANENIENTNENENANENANEITKLTNLVLKILEQNTELTKQVIELSKEKTITTNTNCNNKAFNLNLFLNETCKDAMNMSDFLNQLQLTTKDLELTGQDGFAVGIGHSFVQGIKALEAHKRPLHCSDIKRETFYIKENNIWEKEDENRGKLTKAIQKIAHKNILNIPAWKAEHPHCRDQHHKDNDKFLQIMIESMTGKDDPNIMQEYDKIIRNVAKEVFIDKS